ncbi:hypothetical protein [Dactylosporangium sp. CA-233914]|uniref:ankyrin repeat domain-containing protein n=1 Tax=Dactylosporangium sp. CA-233914 TaxID=3239934 RepID=UPI003D92CB21
MEDAGSIPAGLPFLARELPIWRNIRAVMPPPALVAAAASARAAGDWRGAAALLPATIDVDLPAVRDRFGAEAAAALEDDLRHLCLDLLWWHLPRHSGGRRTLQAQVSAILAPRQGANTAPLVRIKLPKSPMGPQRLLIDVTTLADLEYERWYYAPRPTWDVRETTDLAPLWSGTEVFALLAAESYTEAWRRCGITLNFDPAGTDALQRPTTSPTSPLGVAALAREAAEAFGVQQVQTIFGAYLTLNLPALTADASDPSDWLEPEVRIPTFPVPPDLALLATGLLSPADLHPLMPGFTTPSDAVTPGRIVIRNAPTGAPSTGSATAPSPSAIDAAPSPSTAAPSPSTVAPSPSAVASFPSGAALSASSAAAPILAAAPIPSTEPEISPISAFFPAADGGPDDRAPLVRVRCGVDWHCLAIADGALRLLDHDEEERRREATLRALGGESSGCYSVEIAWRSGGARLPRALHEYRRRVMLRLQHGDTEFLLRGLADGSIDPQMRAGNGWSLMHMALWLDSGRVLPALLAAGVPVDSPDRIGRTPLYEAVMQGGDPVFVRGLLDAGANPRAETVHGATPAYAARNYNDGRDLSFLASL